MYDVWLVESEIRFDGVRGEEELPVAVEDHQEAVQGLPKIR